MELGQALGDCVRGVSPPGRTRQAQLPPAALQRPPTMAVSPVHPRPRRPPAQGTGAPAAPPTWQEEEMLSSQAGGQGFGQAAGHPGAALSPLAVKLLSMSSACSRDKEQVLPSALVTVTEVSPSSQPLLEPVLSLPAPLLHQLPSAEEITAAPSGVTAITWRFSSDRITVHPGWSWRASPALPGPGQTQGL